MTDISRRQAWLLLGVCMLGMLAMLPAVCVAAEMDDTVVTVDVIGTGMVEDEGGVDVANHAAIDNGLLLAVDTVLRQVVPADILAANFSDIDKIVGDIARQCIMNYQVLAVAQREGICRALVRVTVSADRIRRSVIQAGILLDREAPPSVLMLVDGASLAGNRWFVSMDEQSVSTAVVKAMSKCFAARGMKQVDATPFDFEGWHSDMGAGLADSRLVEAGQQVGADFVVTGRLESVRPLKAEEEKIGSPLLRINARVVSVNTGDEIFSVAIETDAKGEDAGAWTPQSVLEDLGLKAARELSPAIVAAWERQSGKTYNIAVTVRGVDYIAQLGSFRSVLESFRQVKDVKVREMKIDEAVLSVETTVEAGKVAEFVDNKRGKGFFVKVLGVSGNSIDVELMSDGH